MARVLDPGWVELSDALSSADPLRFPGYDSRAPDRAVTIAEGTLDGARVEVIVFDFARLGGSLGLVAGERIARTFERAVERRAAVLALLSTGGARMQEGMVALVQMAKTIVARQSLGKAGLPFVAYLQNPTTGGAYASFAGFADIIWAEPEATIGFAGPRVAHAAGGVLAPGSHTAEFALANGLVDAVVAHHDLRTTFGDVVDLTTGSDKPGSGEAWSQFTEGDPERDAWEIVQTARRDDRPTARAIAEAITEQLVEIRGDRAGTDDAGVLTGLGRIDGVRTAIIAHDRRMLTPPAFRKTQRLVRMAGRFGLPLVCLIDTPGADPSSDSEAGGIVRAIAGTYRDIVEHPASTVAIVTGEGGSGAALAFAACDRLYVLENAFFSVIGPEGAAAILRREDVDGVARDLRLTGPDLVDIGIADAVIAEPSEGAHADPADTARRVALLVASAIGDLAAVPDVRASRTARWRAAGNRFLIEP